MKYCLVFILSCLSLAHDVNPIETDPSPTSKPTTTTPEPHTDSPSSNSGSGSKGSQTGFKVSKTVSQFMATVREDPSDLYLCSATFIRKDALLTTARCLLGRNPEKLTIHSNSSNLETEGLENTPIKSVYVHPDFDMSPVTMDFGIITLKEPVDYITPVSLPYSKIGRPGSVGTLYTWRFTPKTDKFLIHERQSKIISNSKCFLLEQEIIPDGMACAEGRLFQKGSFDHGMPFIINRKGKNYLFGLNHITGKLETEKVDKLWKIDGIVPWIAHTLKEDSMKRKRPTVHKTKVVTHDDDDNDVDVNEREEELDEENNIAYHRLPDRK